MSYSKIILQDSANIVWPLDDISTSSSISKAINFFSQESFAFSASINAGSTHVISNPVVFGGGKALSFTSSAVGLSIPAMGLLSELYQNKNSCIEFWFQTDSLSSSEQVIFKKRNNDNIGLYIKDNYLIFRYGTSASFAEVSADIVNLNDPNHIIIGRSPSSLIIIVNGNFYFSENINYASLDEDPSHEQNDYFDFYGPKQNTWTVDSIAYYSNILSTNDAKRHYVYGLGKNIGEDVFYHRGGTFYNLSTIDTEKILKINWDYPLEWQNTTINNLLLADDSIKTSYFSDPEFYSYDTNINTASNSIVFRSDSGSTAVAAYIDVKNLVDKMDSGDYPVFVKVKLDGELPKEGASQRIFTYGISPDRDVATFDLYNNSGSYKILISASDYTTSFNVSNATSKPDIYLGMQFLNKSLFYFAQSGSFIQTASFNYYDANGFGLDPLITYFPPQSNSVFRIGSKLTYSKSNFTIDSKDVSQFSGTFKKLFIHEKTFSSSVNFTYLDSYSKSRYAISYDSSLKRFKTYSYGDLTFNVHSIDMGQFINDNTQMVGANVVNFGYPDIQSSSQVQFYVTQLNYSGSVVYPKTLLSQNNYLNFINNTNISGTYLKFDIELRAEDTSYYPPKIKYFNMETYKGINNTTVLRSDSGSEYVLYPSSSVVYLPEIKRTPTIFMSNESGVKVSKTIIDLTENIAPKPLDPRTIPGLVAWYDSRFINGLGATNPQDDSKISIWQDLSGNNYHAVQSVSASAPVFRSQSLNILTNNQSNGGESGDVANIIGVNCSASPSVDGAVSGNRGIRLSPNNTSVNSYMELGRNTASMTILANQSYSVVGSIKLLKPQTASYLHANARGVAIYIDSGSGMTLTASAISASNSIGTYKLYSEFTSPSVVFDASIRFYNGSFSDGDIVYWDNMAIYPRQSGSYTASWASPLTSFNDMPIVKFNGISKIQSSASAGPLMTLYSLYREFQEDSSNVFEMYIKSGSYTNSNTIVGGSNFVGDYAAVILYSGVHDNSTRFLIEGWLEESFNLPTSSSFIYSIYSASYSNKY